MYLYRTLPVTRRVQNICELLENGGHQCFIAPRDIRSGKEYAEELILGIERSDIIVLLMSNAANRSPHVLREVEHAASSGIPIMVYKLEEVELTKSMEYFLLTNQWVNQNPEEGIQKILKCVNDMQGEPEKNITRRLDMGSADAPAAPVKKNTQKKAVPRKASHRRYLYFCGVCGSSDLLHKWNA